MASSSFFADPLAAAAAAAARAAALQPPSCWPGPPAPEAREAAWGWPPGQSPCSTGGSSSPASSPESCGGGFSPSLAAARRKGARARLAHGQRQSASQREKLRMRHLAQALHALRRYLPASVAPAGQNLTKIETLRLAIRYIGHLSELLGLSEEELARRGAARARPCCPLCPPGLGCGQAAPGPPLPPPEAWPSPQAPPAPPLEGTPRGAARPAACAAPSPPLGSPVLDAAAASWARWAPGAPSGAPAGSGKPALPAWATGGTRAETPPPEEWPPAREWPARPQGLPEELLSFLEGFVPLALQDCLSDCLTPGLEAEDECL